MRTKLFFVTLCIMCLNFSIFANPIDSTTAQKAALSFMQTRNGYQNLKLTDIILAYTSTSLQEGNPQTAYYVFNVGEHAFIIIAADDQSHPVLAYSTSSTFSPEQIPENAKPLLSLIHDNVIGLSKAQTTYNENKTLWNCLLSGEVPAFTNSTKKSVGPLIQTTWSQSPYYNKFCPYDTSTGSLAITGCVATAMAQIIKYWEYPTKGFGHCAYTHPKYGFLSSNYEETTYKYDSMPVILDEFSSESEVNAVAKLMFDCGVGVGMDYSPEGSGAQVISNNKNNYNSEYVLKRYFGYIHNGGYYKYKSPSSWYKDVKNDLDNKRPILFIGFEDHYYNGGHAFICDGYDENGLYHFNWGWNGYMDGYYILDSASTYKFYQGALFGLMPPHKLNNYNLVLNSSLQTNKDTIGCGETFTTTISVLNNGSKAYSGQFKLSLLNSQTKKEIMAFDSISCLQEPVFNDKKIDMKFECTLNKLITSHYILALYYKDTIEDFYSSEWILVNEIGDFSNEKVIRFEGGKTEVEMDSVSEITAHTALVTAHIDESCSENVILKNIQYRKKGSSSFTNLKDTSDGNNIQLTLNNLEANTTYEVQSMVMVESNSTYSNYTSNLLSFTTQNNDAVAEPDADKISIYPNPAQTQINILLPDNSHYMLTVYGELGQKAIVGQCSGPKYTLDVSKLSKGVYFIILQNETKVISNKFVIE